LSEIEAGEVEAACVSVSPDDAKLVEVCDPITGSSRLFHFDYVFGETSSQEEMHRNLGRATLRSFWNGEPCSLVSPRLFGGGYNAQLSQNRHA
jgi:hypothetical protein